MRDFCNTPELFFDGHNQTRIFCWDVATFLQTGVVAMKSAVIKRSVVIAGRKTSVSLEDAFWESLKKIAGKRDTSLSDLLAAIDSGRQHNNLSSAIRLFVLDFYCSQSSETDERHHGPYEMATQGAFN